MLVFALRCELVEACVCEFKFPLVAAFCRVLVCGCVMVGDLLWLRVEDSCCGDRPTLWLLDESECNMRLLMLGDDVV